MRSIRPIALAIIVCALLTSAGAMSEAAEPASQPEKPAEKPDPDVVQWRAHCDLADGRRFITDGSLLLESRFAPAVPIPEKSVGAQGAERLLQSETDHEFGLADLDRNAPGGHYLAPGSIQLNRKYIEFLRGSPLKPSLRFRAKGQNQAVLILDDQKVVGVMMPMKQ
jgi:hypothetical protein